MAARRRPTIHEVARAAGVSVTTVSHALNNKGRVDVHTRERVRRAASDLGYRASHAARGLRSGRTWTLGLMLPQGPAVAGTQDYFGIEFYLDLAVGAAQAAFAQRHGLTLLPDVASREELGLFPLDGVIVNDPVTSDQRLLSLDALEIPYVTIERALDRPEHSRWVAGDTIAGTRKALDHLETTGAERIALLTLRHAWAWLAETEQSYREWCAERGREPIVIDITGRLTADNRLSIDDSLARRLADVDGLFTAPDRCAVAAANALHADGRQVGGDVVLACGVDSRYAQDHTPSITALELQPRALAEAAVTLLLSGGDTPVVLVPELKVRASSATCRPSP